MKEGYEIVQLLSSKIHPKTDFPIKLLQFGTGKFLRTYIEPIVQQLNKKTNFHGGIIIAQFTASSFAQKITKQNGLYTLLTQGL